MHVHDELTLMRARFRGPSHPPQDPTKITSREESSLLSPKLRAELSPIHTTFILLRFLKMYDPDLSHWIFSIKTIINGKPSSSILQYQFSLIITTGPQFSLRLIWSSSFYGLSMNYYFLDSIEFNLCFFCHGNRGILNWTCFQYCLLQFFILD